MNSTLYIEAFGQLLRDPNLKGMISEEEEDLHSVFRERAQLMGWADTSHDRLPKLWAMEEAELTTGDDASRIGWVQVGLEVGDFVPTPTREPSAPVLGILGITHQFRRILYAASPRSMDLFRPFLGRRYTRRYTTTGVDQRASNEPVEVLPALIQCFDDSLRRFGAVEVSGYQVTASGLETLAVDSLGYLGSVLNWFNIDSKARTDAIVAFDQALLNDHDVHKLVAGLRRWKNGTFEFRSVVDVPEECMVKVTTSAFLHPVTPQSPQGVLVSLPEWTPSAAGWVLAKVMGAGRKIRPDASSLAIRITRV